MQTFSLFSRSDQFSLDGVLKDKINTWEVCNMLNNASNQPAYCMNSPGSTFCNDLSAEKIKSKINQEFLFFTGNESYFSQRDQACIRIFFSGEGQKGRMPVSDGEGYLKYKDLIDFIVRGCAENSMGLQNHFD